MHFDRCMGGCAALPAALPLDLTLADRVRVFEMLCEAGRSELAATEALFGPLRQREMIALQGRLRRLADQGPAPRRTSLGNGPPEWYPHDRWLWHYGAAAGSERNTPCS